MAKAEARAASGVGKKMKSRAWARLYKERAAKPLLLLLFFFLFRGWTHPETVRGRAGWVRGGVRRMDAAAKPTRTYLRRPPRTHPARPSAALQSSKLDSTDATATHEGLRRSPEPTPKAQASAEAD